MYSVTAQIRVEQEQHSYAHVSGVQAREAREREEVGLAYAKRMAEVEDGHKSKVAALQKELQEAEDKLREQVGREAGETCPLA
jgi:hypothetical protein